ncbi:hypothetical protein EVAR_30642_1 [Eumeta japonica]|uniref:Uncharacterized protein n=1 Tax=Eumeta variegata TaxID=151549 RepID=A0A4C1VTP7_EUMVA|nr:hypothetical protein EVAR_30642_1 [Eumeta japonica]
MGQSVRVPAAHSLFSLSINPTPFIRHPIPFLLPPASAVNTLMTPFRVPKSTRNTYSMSVCPHLSSRTVSIRIWISSPNASQAQLCATSPIRSRFYPGPFPKPTCRFRRTSGEPERVPAAIDRPEHN